VALHQLLLLIYTHLRYLTAALPYFYLHLVSSPSLALLCCLAGAAPAPDLAATAADCLRLA
jgi:hypothetical protein